MFAHEEKKKRKKESKKKKNPENPSLFQLPPEDIEEKGEEREKKDWAKKEKGRDQGCLVESVFPAVPLTKGGNSEKRRREVRGKKKRKKKGLERDLPNRPKPSFPENRRRAKKGKKKKKNLKERKKREGFLPRIIPKVQGRCSLR